MTARHMRNAAMSDVFDGMEKPITTVHEDDDRIRYAPVAIALTEDEVLALVRVLRETGIVTYLMTVCGLSDEADDALSAVEALVEAADDIESKETDA